MGFIKGFLRPVWDTPLIWKLRGVFFDANEILRGYRIEKRKFLENTGYPLDLRNPKSFNQHLVHKKIFDRNPILPVLADKYRVRQYLKESLGKKDAEEILIPLLYTTSDPKTIPFDELSGEYIIKSNHNSGPHFIIQKGEIYDRQNIIKELSKQIKYNYGILKHEWAYKKIKKKIILVERLLRDENGDLPKDFKFHMIFGKCAFIQVDFDRFTDHSRTLYDKDWNHVNATLKFKQGREEPKPKSLVKMLSLAQNLSKGFDYVRVDLYSIDNEVYFGEMTHYPGSGMEKFTPTAYDFELGKYWENNDQ